MSRCHPYTAWPAILRIQLHDKRKFSFEKIHIAGFMLVFGCYQVSGTRYQVSAISFQKSMGELFAEGCLLVPTARYLHSVHCYRPFASNGAIADGQTAWAFAEQGVSPLQAACHQRLHSSLFTFHFSLSKVSGHLEWPDTNGFTFHSSLFPMTCSFIATTVSRSVSSNR